jgi:hypothetical protein
VGKVLGETVVDVREEAKATLCVYQTQSLIFELSFIKTGGLSASQFMQNIQAIHADTFVLVPGLGDEAFYTGVPSYNLLQVRKGELVNSFGVRNVTADGSLSAPANAQELEKALAELLLSRLP